MADEAVALPPQAAAGLPGEAAAAGDLAVVPAPSAVDALLPSAYGDQGAQDYRDLQSAATPPTPTPTPAAPPTGAPPSGAAPQPNIPGSLAQLIGPAGVAGMAGTGGATAPAMMGPPSRLGAALLGFATGDPTMGLKLRQQADQHNIAVLREMRANSVEFYTQLVPSIFKQFQGRPDLAAQFLLSEAAQRGIQTNPATLMWMDDQLKTGKMSVQDIAGALNTTPDINTLARFGETIKNVNALTKGKAEAEEAQEKLRQTQMKTPFAGAKTPAEMAASQAVGEGLTPGSATYNARVSSLVGQYQANTRITEATQGGATSEQLTNRADAISQLRKNGVIPPDATDLSPYISDINKTTSDIAAYKAGRLGLAKEQATTVAATRTMQDGAKTVKFLTGQVRDDLAAVNRGGGSVEASYAQQRAMAKAMDSLAHVDPATGNLIDNASGKVIDFDTLRARLRGFATQQGLTQDPAFAQYLADTALLTTALMRMHVGARGGEYIMQHFQAFLDAQKQNGTNMAAALNRIDQYADFIGSEQATKQWDFDQTWGQLGGQRGAATGRAGGAPQQQQTQAPVQIQSEADVARLKLAPGTKIILNGRVGTVQ